MAYFCRVLAPGLLVALALVPQIGVAPAADMSAGQQRWPSGNVDDDRLLRVTLPSDAEAGTAKPADVLEQLQQMKAVLAARDRELAAMRAEMQYLRERARLETEIEQLKTDVAARQSLVEVLQAELSGLRAEGDTAPPTSAKPSLTEVHFESSSARLTPGGQQRAQEAAESMVGLDLKAVRIVGHTDRLGDAATNEALSQARAEAVATFLADAGIDPALIQVSWLGESAPPIATPDGVAEPLNRCVGIIPVVATN